MTRGALCLAVAVLAAATTTSTPTGCQPGSPYAEVEKAGAVTYTTQPGDSPYRLAKRFYGDAYMEYKIREANKALLTQDGLFPPGKEIVIPPDNHGRPVDLARPVGR